ncbi:MAG TPA: Vms1/Ankzf1 family peptidyl-tRNA hydrolase [Gaiellaceae bacterium]|jgi:peptide chain release factor subunit 1|nr:Vms1/Ankzf1 family peptidyl-tRNA hydrolase [Gaiellaceae bacterium]
MARTITWDELRDLAGFEAEKGCAISLYLDLDPHVSPTPADAATRLHSLLDEGSKGDGANRRDLTHDQRVGLRADFERIREFYEREFTRNGAHGLAIFSSGLDNIWRPLPLTEAVPDRVKVGQTLYLAPLVPLVGRGEGALILVVGRELGHFYRLRGGRLEDLADHTEDQPGRHDQGGWSQARYQRHIEMLVRDHLKEVAEALDRIVRRLRSVQVVVISSEETKAEFEELLSHEALDAVIGWTSAEAHATPAELLELATPVLERYRTEQETHALDRWHEEVGRGGRAAAGWEATLEAASDARVDLLLFEDGVDHAAFRCPRCGRVAVQGGTCPLDGTSMEASSDGLDLAVHQALLHGGRVWAVRHRQDLEPVEGIGALLRY